MKRLLLALAVVCFIAFSAADCNVSVQQSKVTSWQQDGKDFSQWNAELVASGSEDVASVQLSATNDASILNLWELKKDAATGRYNLPAWRLMNGGLPTGQTHRFGYIVQSADQAQFKVESVQCQNDETPTPTPVVSTPQPGGGDSSACTLAVTQTKRSAADGGSWTSGDFGFQIYDLQLTNNGGRPATGARLNINLRPESQQQIQQFWNVERQSAESTVFNVPTPWGAIQPGASQGAGYILRYPLSAASQQTDPGVTVVSSTCDGEATGNPATPTPPIVGTPQPSAAPAPGCSASVSVSARGSDRSGSWTANGASFQIFDLVIANTGSQPVTGADVTFGLPDGTTVFQWWEINERVGSTTVFDVSFQYGPLQVGATQGAGIVAKSASASQQLPQVTLGSVRCN